VKSERANENDENETNPLCYALYSRSSVCRTRSRNSSCARRKTKIVNNPGITVLAVTYILTARCVVRRIGATHFASNTPPPVRPSVHPSLMLCYLTGPVIQTAILKRRVAFDKKITYTAADLLSFSAYTKIIIPATKHHSGVSLTTVLLNFS